MATAAPKTRDESDIFNCTICLERFTKPKYLPCLHTFCEACLNTYIVSTQSDQEKPVSFNCPVCRQEVKSPDSKTPLEKWAKLMPLNHMLFSLMENTGIGNTPADIKCSPCERGEGNTTAAFWCLDCREGLCETCKKHHKQNKLSTTHKIIPTPDLKKLDLSIHVSDIEEPCLIHKGEVLKVYCEEHKEMCCVICLSISHRRCDNIKTLDQMADSMKIGEINVQLVDKLGKICTRVKSLVDKKQQNIDNIQVQQQDIVKEASDMVEQAITNLHKCHEEFKTQFSQMHKGQNTKLIDAKESMETFHDTLFNYQKTFKTVLEHGSPKQIFITSEKIKKQLKIQWDVLQEFVKDDQDIEYQASMDGTLASVKKITSLAEVQIKSIPCAGSLPMEMEALFCLEIPSLDLQRQSKSSKLQRQSESSELRRKNERSDLQGQGESSDLQRQLKMANISELTAVKLWDVNGGGWYTGGTFLDDGRLLCVDYRKKTINLFDDGGNFQMSHSLGYQPRDVAQHSDGRIFVTGTNTNDIKIYNLSKKALHEIKIIEFQKGPFTINIINDFIYVVARCKMHVMTSEGSVLQTFDLSHDNCYIATSEFIGEESKFYYYDEKILFCKTVNCKEIKKYIDLQIESARGISLDCDGNVYICDRDSKNIFVVSKDFKASHVFMSNLDSIDRPYAMEFDKTGTKFFISGFDNGALAVYQLCVKK